MKWLSDKLVNRLKDVSVIPDLSQTQYTIIRKIGSGGMGNVYLVKDSNLKREVALKVLKLEKPSKELVSRMMNEAWIIAGLEHPGIIPIHDVGTLSDGTVYYTMMHVQGVRLDKLPTNEYGHFEKLQIFLKVCEAISFAHAKDVIHRDIKPENIMVGQFGEVLVMDWGIAKILKNGEHKKFSAGQRPAVGHLARPGGEDSDLNSLSYDGTTLHTADGIVMGTPEYMAPESLRGPEHHNVLSDLYSLGAVLYFLLAGVPPQKKRDSLEPSENNLTHSLTPPKKIDIKIPKLLNAICLKALQNDPGNRYANAHDLADDIEKFLNGLPVKAHDENILEKTYRWIKQYSFILFLIFTYLFIRILLYFLA